VSRSEDFKRDKGQRIQLGLTSCEEFLPMKSRKKETDIFMPQEVSKVSI
jgi:hypothetical protein